MEMVINAAKIYSEYIISNDKAIKPYHSFPPKKWLVSTKIYSSDLIAIGLIGI